MNNTDAIRLRKRWMSFKSASRSRGNSLWSSTSKGGTRTTRSAFSPRACRCINSDSLSASIPSDFARRLLRETSILAESMTHTSCPSSLKRRYG